MARIALKGGQILAQGGTFVSGTVLIEGTKITGIISDNLIPDDAILLDVSGSIVSPGFIDTHVHGGGGHNFMEATREAYSAISDHMVRGGVTSCLATTTSVSLPNLIKTLEYASFMTQHPIPNNVEILGIHMEGPYLNPLHRGVHIAEHIREAEITELEQIYLAQASALRVVTLAPEMPFGLETTRFFAERGIGVSIGHTGATYEQVKTGLANGACRGTHVFNAMPPIHHRKPGPIPALFEDQNATLEFIVDGHHVHPSVVKMAVQEIGPSRGILITDCTDVAGLGEGVYTRWEGTEVRIEEGQSRTASGSLAGSVLRMDQGVKNLVEKVELPIGQALLMATENPAKSIGVYKKKGSISPGKDADIVVLNGDLSIGFTMIKGQIVYSE
ncbi:MAG TPA: N-acetylglucosamine-6-phosphate deacetylase [Neobacillus sp.]